MNGDVRGVRRHRQIVMAAPEIEPDAARAPGIISALGDKRANRVTERLTQQTRKFFEVQSQFSGSSRHTRGMNNGHETSDRDGARENASDTRHRPSLIQRRPCGDKSLPWPSAIKA
ncbi:MAG: hypothetical protein AB7E80_09915 [Hyphomicrobiaceae bacterium]